MAKRSYAFPVAASFSPRLRAIPWYTVSETELEVGASLGNSAVWVNTKSTGAIERVFSLDRGTSFFGSVIIRYAGSGAVPKDASSEDGLNIHRARARRAGHRRTSPRLLAPPVLNRRCSVCHRDDVRAAHERLVRPARRIRRLRTAQHGRLRAQLTRDRIRALAREHERRHRRAF